MYVCQCSKCKHMSGPLNGKSTPKDWRPLAIAAATYMTYTNSVVLHFCPKCADELHIPEETKNDITPAEQMLDIIETLIAEQVEIQLQNQ